MVLLYSPIALYRNLYFPQITLSTSFSSWHICLHIVYHHANVPSIDNWNSTSHCCCEPYYDRPLLKHPHCNCLRLPTFSILCNHTTPIASNLKQHTYDGATGSPIAKYLNSFKHSVRASGPASRNRLPLASYKNLSTSSGESVKRL